MQVTTLGTVGASSEVMSGILNWVCPNCGGSMGGAGKEFKCQGECRPAQQNDNRSAPEVGSDRYQISRRACGEQGNSSPQPNTKIRLWRKLGEIKD